MNFESFYIVIWIVAFFTAIVSAAVGMLGGTLILAVLAQYLPMQVLVPVHGLIQLGSNGVRAWLLRPFIEKQITKAMIAGIIVGSVLGAFYLKPVEEAYYNIGLGTFIIAITLLPKLLPKQYRRPLNFRGKWLLLGFIASSLGLYVGAIGVLVGAVMLTAAIEKKPMVATQAVAQTVLHAAKVLVFIYLGFAIGPWLLLLGGALVMTWTGTWVGTKILDKIPEQKFRKILLVIVVALALRLVITGIRGLN